MRLSTLSILLAVAIEVACDNCSCGYAINNTALLFTDSLETDFLHVTNFTEDTVGAWIPQSYNSTAQASHGPYGKVAEIGNVIPNPVHSIYDWSGPGLVGGPPGLQLWVRSALVPQPGNPSAPLVPIAEVVSARSDLLYGSFRAAFRTTAVNGTCAAFFTFFNDSSEIDMELLSRQQSPPFVNPNNLTAGLVNLVIQSPASAQVGYVPITSPDFALIPFPATPGAAGPAADTYNEYRVDWLPDRVDFFLNTHLLTSMTTNVPALPARLHLIHWSDGNPGWSAGPPQTDAVMTVSYVKAYFNSSTGDPRPAACTSAQHVCVVPDVEHPPDPMGANGNVTGKTVFFQDPLVNATWLAERSQADGALRARNRGWVGPYFGVVVIAVTMHDMIFGPWGF